MKILLPLVAATLFFSFAASARADVPPFDGLPMTISARLPEQRNFVRFEPLPNHHAPMLTQIGIDGGDRSFSLGDAFAEEFWALLPPRQKIQTRVDAQGRESWDYPAGMRIVHRIFLRTVPRTIFELRVIWKRGDGKWSYGLYAPSDVDHGSDTLRLHAENRLPVEIHAIVRGDDANHSGPVRITGNRLSPVSCRACHFAFSAASYQYPERELAGPCGFVPGNASVVGKWAPEYRRVHGYWPF